MRYTPDFEPLADALKRVMASGLSEDQAKLDICGAVADGKVDVRVRVSIAATDNAMRGRVFYRSNRNVAVPPHLDSTDLDWVQSRPLKPWQIGPAGPQRYSDPFWQWESQPLDLIELSTADIMSILNMTAAGPTNFIRRSSKSGPGAKARGIEDAINQLWPDEIPKGLSAKDRNRAILDKIKQNGGSIPVDPARAIQRALKRRHVQ
jgi:hypothetical protein